MQAVTEGARLFPLYPEASIDVLIEAKAARDHVRDLILRELRKVDSRCLYGDLAALLKADEETTAALRAAEGL